MKRYEITAVLKIMLVFALFFIYGCSKEDNPDKNNTDDPYNEQGLVLINKVSEQCGNYIESYLDQYFSQSGNADIKDLVKKINNIDEVEEASTNDDNSVIRIELKNGACFNFVIFREDDERLITEDMGNLIQQFSNAPNLSNNITTLRATESNYNTPTVKKALILAPFQSSFNDDLSDLDLYLRNAGYDVTLFANQDATIDKFRGEYLKQFGVIYIHTHGSYSSKSLSRKESSMVSLVTGSKFNSLAEYLSSNYDKWEGDNLGLVDLYENGVLYLSVSEEWISKNLSSLPNSFVYIDACYSAKNAQLPNIFFNSGAGAYVGWVGMNINPLGSAVSKTVFNNLSKGIEFDDEVYSNPLYSNLFFQPGFAFNGKDYIGGYFHNKMPSNVPYYLIKKDEPEESGDWVLINGVKWATCNVGITPGTFVANPEDYGGYYQWNRRTTDLLSIQDYDKSVYANATSWLSANDPSPIGYRVPTSAEIESLLNTTFVTNEWTTKNGVNGRKFIDKASGKNMFLPVASSETKAGMYWSSTISSLHFSSPAMLSLYFDATYIEFRDLGGGSNLNVRCVAK